MGKRYIYVYIVNITDENLRDALESRFGELLSDVDDDAEILMEALDNYALDQVFELGVSYELSGRLSQKDKTVIIKYVKDQEIEDKEEELVKKIAEILLGK